MYLANIKRIFEKSAHFISLHSYRPYLFFDWKILKNTNLSVFNAKLIIHFYEMKTCTNHTREKWTRMKIGISFTVEILRRWKWGWGQRCYYWWNRWINFICQASNVFTCISWTRKINLKRKFGCDLIDWFSIVFVP